MAAPGWLLAVGIVLLAVGLIGFVADLALGGGPVGDSFGSFSLAVDLALDAFLVVAGALTIRASRLADASRLEKTRPDPPPRDG